MHGLRRRSCEPFGFTLIEVLVVVAIIALLIGILLPSISAAREQAKRSACLANLRSIGQAIMMYADANKEWLPNGNSPGTVDDPDGSTRVLSALVRRFTKTPQVLHCPSDKDPAPKAIVTADYLLPDSARVSYDYYSIWWLPEYGPKLTQIPQAPVGWDLEGGNPRRHPFQNHGNKGGNVAFADSHAEWQVQQRWDKKNWPNPASRYYLPKK